MKDDKKTQISVSLTVSEKKEITRAAFADCRTPTATWARRKLLEAAEQQPKK